MPERKVEEERILVCVSASPTSVDVIRRASALSRALGAELIAVYVENTAVKDDTQSRAVHDHLAFAERHGARLTTVFGDDPATAIARYARVSRITKIVLGKSPRRRNPLFSGKTLMSRLNELAPDVEIIIVPNRLKADTRRFTFANILRGERLSLSDLLKTLLTLAACTGTGFLFSRIGLAITNIVLIYILGVMGVALLTTGLGYSLLSSLLAVLIFNFFFTEPYYSLASSPDYLATFAVMFAAALLSSSFTSRIKAQSILTANKAYQTEVLLSTSQLLQKAEGRNAILHVAQRQLSRLMEHSVLCYDRLGEELSSEPMLLEIDQDGGFADVLLQREKEIAAWVVKNKKHAGRGTQVHPEAICLYMAVYGEDRVWAVMGIRADNAPGIDEYRKNLMISILDECALALEKDHMTREKQRMEESARQEALRANLLRAISHDLRTPLTSISGNAAILLENPEQLGDDKRKELYESIYDDAIWLNGLVENLLTVTRTENGTMKLNLQTEVISDAVEEALRHLDRNASKRHIMAQLSNEMLIVLMDAGLIVQVLINLINNAVKYTPEGANITIGTAREEDKALVWVEDDGQGVPPGDEDRVFDMFYTGVKRSPDSRRGIGLGLALCRSIVQAHGGEIHMKNIRPHGAKFYFTLPVAEVKEYEQ